jgi:hypothetical protein
MNRNPLSWKPHLGPVSRTYITAGTVSDLYGFPTLAVRDVLVDVYLKDIHPGFPSILWLFRLIFILLIVFDFVSNSIRVTKTYR